MRKASPYSELIEAALHLAELAGAAILPHFRQTLDVENKNESLGLAGFDPVTAADKAAEAAIRQELARRFPDHAIEGEEYGTANEGADYRWIIDPIDGTRSFMMGMLTWGTLIGLSRAGRPLLGVMAQPYSGELFWSGETTAHYRGPRGAESQLKARRCRRLGDAVLACTHPSLFANAGELARYEAVSRQVKMSRFGGDCYAYAMVAAGNIDVVIEASLKSFDIAALIPIIERAGGKVTTWSGGPAKEGGQIVASGDPVLHDLVLDALAKPPG